jgi:uncharacterized protein YfiM (DUF2279 family)
LAKILYFNLWQKFSHLNPECPVLGGAMMNHRTPLRLAKFIQFMSDRRLPAVTLFMTRRFLKTFFKFLIFAGLIGWWADLAQGQDSTRAIPDSTVGAHQKLSRDLWLGKDKFDHALASAGLVAAQFYVLHQEFEMSDSRSRQIAAGSTLVIGIAKEIYDKVSRRGTPSWKDLLADFVGVALAVGIMTQ